MEMSFANEMIRSTPLTGSTVTEYNDWTPAQRGVA